MAQVLAIAGSPSHPSCSYAVLEQAKAQLSAQHISTEILAVRDLPAEALLYAQFDHPAIQAATALGCVLKLPPFVAQPPAHEWRANCESPLNRTRSVFNLFQRV